MLTVPFKLSVGEPLERPQDRESGRTRAQPRVERVSGARARSPEYPRARAPLPGTQTWRRALPRLLIGAHAPSCHGRPGPAPWALPEWTVPGHANEGMAAAAHWPAAECR